MFHFFLIFDFTSSLKSDLKLRRCPISKKVENGGKKGERELAIVRVLGNSGPTPVARGGCGAKTPPLGTRVVD